MTVDYLQRLFVLYELMFVTCTVGGHGCGGWGLLCGARLFQDLGCCQEHIPTGTLIYVHVTRLEVYSTSVLVLKYSKHFLWMVLQAFFFTNSSTCVCLQNHIKITSKSSLQWPNTYYAKISQQLYMLQQYRLYCSVQLKIAVWWYTCTLLSILSTLQKWQFLCETPSLHTIRRFSSIWVNFNSMRYWYHWNVQLILSEIMW